MNFSRIIPRGSVHDVTYTRDNFDFDNVMAFKFGKNEFDVEESRSVPGIVKLVAKEVSQEKTKKLCDKDCLSPGRLMQHLSGTIVKANNDFEEKNPQFKIKERPKGGSPAVRVDISGGKLNQTIHIDLVPVVQFSEDEQYVPKPIKTAKKEMTVSDIDDDLAWRKNFALQEKQEFVGLDKDNLCHKKVLQLVKFLSRQEPTLEPISSYMWKSALFEVIKNHPDPRFWHLNNIGFAMMTVMQTMHGYFEKGKIPHRFMAHVNLIYDLSGVQIQNIRDRLKVLLGKKQRLYAFLGFGEPLRPIACGAWWNDKDFGEKLLRLYADSISIKREDMKTYKEVVSDYTKHMELYLKTM